MHPGVGGILLRSARQTSRVVLPTRVDGTFSGRTSSTIGTSRLRPAGHVCIRMAKIRIDPLLTIEMKRSNRGYLDRPIWAAKQPIRLGLPSTRETTPGTVPRFPQAHASTMYTTMNDVHTLDDLRRFIHKTLCEKENLLVDQFTMTESS